MANENNKVYVSARETHGLGGCFPVIKLHDWTEQEKQTAEEASFEELLSKLLAIPLSTG